MLSNYLAEIWGISIVIIALALLIKEKHLKRLFVAVETEQGLFLWGVIAVITGVAMVLAHNVWIQGWQVIITIFGWITLIKGIILLFAPEITKSWTKKMENKQWLPITLTIAVIFGLIVTYLGFTA